MYIYIYIYIYLYIYLYIYMVFSGLSLRAYINIFLGVDKSISWGSPKTMWARVTIRTIRRSTAKHSQACRNRIARLNLLKLPRRSRARIERATARDSTTLWASLMKLCSVRTSSRGGEMVTGDGRSSVLMTNEPLFELLQLRVLDRLMPEWATACCAWSWYWSSPPALKMWLMPTLVVRLRIHRNIDIYR